MTKQVEHLQEHLAEQKRLHPLREAMTELPGIFDEHTKKQAKNAADAAALRVTVVAPPLPVGAPPVLADSDDEFDEETESEDQDEVVDERGRRRCSRL